MHRVADLPCRTQGATSVERLDRGRVDLQREGQLFEGVVSLVELEVALRHVVPAAQHDRRLGCLLLVGHFVVDVPGRPVPAILIQLKRLGVISRLWSTNNFYATHENHDRNIFVCA